MAADEDFGTCKYHTMNDSVIHDLKTDMRELLKGQQELSIKVAMLCTALQSVDGKIGKQDEVTTKAIEELVRKNSEQDKKIDGMKSLMYKASGLVTGTIATLTFILKFFGG